MRCLQCAKKPLRFDSRFCSQRCKKRFAKTMPETITCGNCDAQVDGVMDAYAAGWKGIVADPEGYSWNYLGDCPGCQEPSD